MQLAANPEAGSQQLPFDLLVSRIWGEDFAIALSGAVSERGGEEGTEGRKVFLSPALPPSCSFLWLFSIWSVLVPN
jgi:hypothetical protein